MASSSKEQRRQTAPAGFLPPPEGPPRPSGRPPSPLRHGFTANTYTGIDPNMEDDDSESGDDEEEDNQRRGWQRSPSPSSSVSHFAAQFAQRVGSFVGGIAQSPTTASPGYLPTDAELEAEAQRERDRTRLEAEQIMNRESRQHVGDRVLAMLETDDSKSLPPPPLVRSQTTPNPPSPSGSQKEGLSWWNAAKNKLTPTKEALTPAQQLIQEVKTKDKYDKKLTKGRTKSTEEWPASPDTKFSDPAFQNLGVPRTPPRLPHSLSASPSPIRPGANLQINMTPSPMRSGGVHSPARGEATPLYAQFDPEGALDVPSTLLTIAKRFEKLEKWTVGHVRALEERMNDVERWLVDKEEEKIDGSSLNESQATHDKSGGERRGDDEIRELRDEVAELQGRLGELGREMANLATKNLSSGPTKQSAHLEDGHRAISSVAIHSQVASIDRVLPVTPTHKLAPSTARESTSPPMAQSGHTKTPTGGTRRPYPTGDYTSPVEPTSSMIRTTSPSSPSPRPSGGGTRPLTIPGLPSSTSQSGLGIGFAPSSASTSYSSGSFSAASSMSDLESSLRAPKMPVNVPPPRQESSSPTPRKRYTVALGAPINDGASRMKSPPLPVNGGRGGIYSQALSTSPTLSDDRELDDDDQEDLGGETIGKSAAAKMSKNHEQQQQRPSRIRPQSTYAGLSSMQTPASPTKPRTRSHSTDRFASTDSLGSLSSATSTNSKFVDPLIQRRAFRKDTIDKLKAVQPKVEKKKVPVGQLVAFFDESRKP